MGFIDIDEARDYFQPDSGGMGSASTTNTSVQYEVEPNPIGFIWPKEKDERSDGSSS